MARWTSTVAQDLKWAGYRFTGAAGTVFSIADEQKASFAVDPGLTIAGLTWTNSFPSAPVTGQREWREDLGEWCYYDGTRWLSTVERAIYFKTSALAPHTAYWDEKTANPAAGADIYVTTANITWAAAAPQAAPNYWYIGFYKIPNGSGASTQFGGNPDTNGMATGVWNAGSFAINTVVTWASGPTLYVAFTKAGSAGQLYEAVVSLNYRKIYT